MSTSSLENEDLDNVPLVRMEDVQPSRDRILEPRTSSKDDSQVYETCIIDDIEYENECVVNDDEDSNIGSMVSLQSEDVYEEDSSSQELIIPEVLEEVETENDEDELEIFIDNQQNLSEYIANPIGEDFESEAKFEVLEDSVIEEPTPVKIRVTAGDKKKVAVKPDVTKKMTREYKVNPKEYVIRAPCKAPAPASIEVEVPPNKVKRVDDNIVVTPASESWPTLEILPGGVIKNTDKYENESSLYPDKVQETVVNTGEMMYACAKCSQTFKYLFCLVKHVKWHEDQVKLAKNPNLSKLKNSSNQYICLHSGKKKILVTEKTKRKTPKRLKS